jgi:hypothetical protein
MNKIIACWLLLVIRPRLFFKLKLVELQLWLSRLAHSYQIKLLTSIMKSMDKKADFQKINEHKYLYFVVSAIGSDLKMSGFYAETPEQYKLEQKNIPGNILFCMSMAEMRIQIITNYIKRNFQTYKADVMAKNGGSRVH